MKNQVLFITVLLLIFVFACQKTIKTNDMPTPNAKRELSLSINSGMLSFESEQSFQDALNLLDSVDWDTWETQNGFTSLRTSYLNTLTEDERLLMDELPIGGELMTLLNANSMIIITPWIIKLNNQTKKVWVMPVSEIQNIDDIVNENTANSNLRVFDYQDDVFEMLDNSAAKCNQSCTNGDRDKYKERHYCTSNNRDFKSKFKIKYVGFGIWHPISLMFSHRCMANCSSVVPGGGNLADFTNFSVAYTYTYTQKCQGTYNANVGHCYMNFQQTVLCNSGRDWNNNLYNGTRCLSSFDVSANVAWVNMCTTNVNFENEYLQINN